MVSECSRELVDSCGGEGADRQIVVMVGRRLSR